MAPILFSRFGGQIAADVMSAIFPVYGWLLLFCSLICSVAAAFVFKERNHFGFKSSVAALSVGGLSLVLAMIQALYIFPRSHELRNIVKSGRAAGNIDSVAEQAAEMMKLHGVSMTVNTALVFAAIFMFWFFQRTLRRLQQ